MNVKTVLSGAVLTLMASFLLYGTRSVETQRRPRDWRRETYAQPVNTDPYRYRETADGGYRRI